jgi:hypothetical protein
VVHSWSRFIRQNFANQILLIPRYWYVSTLQVKFSQQIVNTPKSLCAKETTSTKCLAATGGCHPETTWISSTILKLEKYRTYGRSWSSPKNWEPHFQYQILVQISIVICWFDRLKSTERTGILLNFPSILAFDWKYFVRFLRVLVWGSKTPLFLGAFFMQKLPNASKNQQFQRFWPVFGTEKKYRTHEGKVDPNFLELPTMTNCVWHLSPHSCV